MLPAWANDPHPADALNHRNAINRATNWPPAIACFFQKFGSGKPLVACDQGPIATIAAGLDLKTEQLAPVFQAWQTDEVLVWRQRRPASQPANCLAYSPETDRIETNDNRASVRSQHTINFAQYLVRISDKFKHMRQNNQINAFGCDREFFVAFDNDVSGLNVVAIVGGIVTSGDNESTPHAVLPKRTQLTQAALNRDETK